MRPLAARKGPSLIYYEDIEVGDVTEHGTCEVTREEMIDFSTKYDPQPFHLSDEAAAKTHFGRLSASGWHTCALANGVIARNIIRQNRASVGSPGIDELRWLRPVFAGDKLSVSGEILEKRPLESRPTIGIFKAKATVTNQNGEVVLTFVANILIRQRPSSEANA